MLKSISQLNLSKISLPKKELNKALLNQKNNVFFKFDMPSDIFIKSSSSLAKKTNEIIPEIFY